MKSDAVKCPFCGNPEIEGTRHTSNRVCIEAAKLATARKCAGIAHERMKDVYNSRGSRESYGASLVLVSICREFDIPEPPYEQ